MTLGTWSPDKDAPTQPSAEQLQQATELGRDGSEAFPDVPPEGLQTLQPWMRQTRRAWHPMLQPMATEQLIDLVLFFTLAEQHWAGWEGGEKNPVVWVCKELKTRDAFPDDELTQWIKSHTENRFLPYGNPLA